MPIDLVFEMLSNATLADCAGIAQQAPDAWSLQDLQAALTHSNQFCFVALSRNIVVGFACYLVVDNTADLRLVAVHPAFRQQGIGQALLTYSLQNLASKGVKNCLLEVRESNINAIHLYKKLGFKKIVHRKNLYTAPVENGFLMGFELTQTL